jgi:hypothetical protein
LATPFDLDEQIKGIGRKATENPLTAPFYARATGKLNYESGRTKVSNNQNPEPKRFKNRWPLPEIRRGPALWAAFRDKRATATL